MRLTRVTLAVAAGALAPALLFSTPSFAAPVPPPTAVAAASDTGSPYDGMDIHDLRIAILRILSDPDSGRRVTREINELLDHGTAQDIRTWLETGYPLAQFEDDRVAIVRLLADPDSGRRVTREINELLDHGTAQDIRTWLETG
ncbi:ALF repeat-containing protein, partial [Streptomyces sp. NPDC055186]